MIAVTASSKAAALLAIGADQSVDRSLFGCKVLRGTVFANLIRRIEAGDIKPLVAQSFALEQMREAQTQFETKASIGKRVIAIDTAR